jgi:hypothetical protein
MENLKEQSLTMTQAQINPLAKAETELTLDHQVMLSPKVADKVSSDLPSLKAPSQNLYNEALRAELIELQSDTDLLFQQLQALSRRRLSQVGSFS